jgi:hypothetical protein
MNQNVTASFGLSVLIVLVFAVALYQPDPPPATAASEPSPAAPAPAPQRAETPAGPPLLPTAATLGNPSALPPPPAVANRPQVPTMARGAAVAAPVRARPVSRRSELRPPVEPRGAFTVSRAGESLADVASRVYGSRDDANRLWRANRDVLDHADVALHAGTLLRTP